MLHSELQHQGHSLVQELSLIESLAHHIDVHRCRHPLSLALAAHSPRVLSVAANTHTPQVVLLRLAMTEGGIAQAALENRNLELQDKLQLAQASAACNLVGDVAPEPELRWALLESRDEGVIARILIAPWVTQEEAASVWRRLRRPNLIEDVVRRASQSEVVQLFADHVDPHVRSLVARHQGTRPEVLVVRLAQDLDPEVRMQVAKKHNCPPAQRWALAGDPEEQVRDAALVGISNAAFNRAERGV